jgi:glucose/mannose-6-phosphate isomerase
MRKETVENLIAELARMKDEPEPPGSEQEGTRARSEYESTLLRHATLRREAAMELLALLGPEAYLDEARILEDLDDSPLEYEREGRVVQTKGMMDRLTHAAEHLVELQEPARLAVRKLPTQKREEVRKIKVYGVGGSATPAAIAREITENSDCLGFEFEVVRRDRPRLENVGNDTLLVFSSFSGNTEEVLNCLACAIDSKRAAGPMIAMSSGGVLQQEAERHGIPWIPIPKHVHQPRESLSLQLSALLTVVSELRLPSGSVRSGPFSLTTQMLQAACARVRESAARFHYHVPFGENPAKQFAARLLYGSATAGTDGRHALVQRIPIVLSAASSEAVAYEFYTQLCEASKILCHVATCPEAFHNLVESMKFSLASRSSLPWSLCFIASDDDSPRVLERWCCTLKEVFPDVEPCSFRAEGAIPFERSVSAYYFCAWVRLYVAFLNGAEPLPVPTMSYMKRYMQGVPRPGLENLPCSAQEVLDAARPQE